MLKAAFLKTILLCSMFIHTSSQVRGGVRKAEPNAESLRMKMEMAKANAPETINKLSSSMQSVNGKGKLNKRLDEIKINGTGALQKVKKNKRKRANRKRKLEEENDYLEFYGVSCFIFGFSLFILL